MPDPVFKAPPPEVHDGSLVEWFASLSPEQRLAELESRIGFFESLRKDNEPQLPRDS